MISAASHKGPDRRQAVGVLIERYLPALANYVRARWRLRDDQADDLLQAFIADKVLEKDLFARADRGRGRFRSLLMTALDRFVISAYRRAGSAEQVCGPASLNGNLPEPAGAAAADVFDLAWARHALYRCLEQTRQECERSGRGQVWQLFAARVVAPALEGAAQPSYGELKGRFGFASPEQASNLLITAKRMFLRNLRAVVAEYARDPAEVDEEVRHLRQILAR
jgi:RNA polymerase sigma-70 factor (ECF subfamily)